MYTLVQQMVDQAIGDVITAIPKSVLANTVIVFASTTASTLARTACCRASWERRTRRRSMFR